MTSTILIRTALYAIARHKGRSLLTILGIMIGVAAIIITFSIGRGAEERVRSQILTMGEGAAYIIPGNIITRGAVRSSLVKPVRLTESDMYAIRDQVPEIKEISRMTHTLELLEFKGIAVKERVLGTDANVLKINKNKLKWGEFFNPTHVENRINVAVLGEKIAEKFFGTEYPIGQTIRISGYPFIVIGVIKHQEHFWGTEDINMRTFVPFTVAKKYFTDNTEAPEYKDIGATTLGDEDLGAIALSFYKMVDSKIALRKIKRILRFRHNIDPEEEDDFTMLDQESITEAAERASSVIKLFGLIAASISLLVGGIGIMNIMLVSVQERTKEIGIRLAIGATQGIIQLQFLLEAMILSGFGGIIGILLGLIGQLFISHTTNLPYIIELGPLILSFFCTLLIGIFFGYYPARKASLLNPIDALLER
jgi:putative ABC transport system permease protein